MVVCSDGAAGARRQRRLVTLRCAGRDRRTVSGRGVPRTRVASLVSHRTIEVPPGGSAPAAPPQRGWCVGSGGGGEFLAQGLLGHGGPHEAGELAGDGGDRDGRAFATAG